MNSEILLMACYESGHQPLNLAWPLAFINGASPRVTPVDLSVQAFPEEAVRRARFVGISAPMHTALRLGMQAAGRVRVLNPRAHICFFGWYAWLNADHLLAGLADSVLAGELEATLADLIHSVENEGDPAGLPGVTTSRSRARPILSRLSFPIPNRSNLPTLSQYVHFVGGSRHAAAGYVESSRGCLHTCRHCPIVPIYQGRYFVVPAETVLADIRQQVEAGAGHVTFGDPDFLNGPGHSLKIVRALHAEFPNLSFDFTTKVEHILKHRTLFREFAALGCTLITSAIESVSERVLEKLNKGHTTADIDAALAILDEAGIAMRPTLVAFTPWTSLDDYIGQVEFIRERSLQAHVPPVQLAVRLLVPPGSALTEEPEVDRWLGELDPEGLSHRWAHPDGRMDQLYEQVSGRVEEAEANGEPMEQTHAAIRAMAYAAARRPVPEFRPVRVRPKPPRLTENWFC